MFSTVILKFCHNCVAAYFLLLKSSHSRPFLSLLFHRLWADLPTAVRDGFCKEVKRGEVWSKSDLALGGLQYKSVPPASPPRDTQKPAKIGALNITACHFGPEHLVNTKLIRIVCKKSIGTEF